MSLYLGNTLISGVATPTVPNRNIGQIIESTLPITDAGLHLLDGSLISGTGIYAGFVNYIANLYGDGTNVPDYFCSESDWQTAVTTYGVCGKFVYDSTNNTVRLPKITGIVEGTTDTTALGDLVEAGLPNITGILSSLDTQNISSGAFYTEGTHSGNNSIDYGNKQVFKFDASRSNAIYGRSNTVQPQTIKVFYYIVIATSTKTEIEVDIDEVATDLNAKLDKDGGNITNSLIDKLTPDYANCISGSAGSGAYIQVTKTSVVFAGGTDPYSVNAAWFVSPDNGTTKYQVGYLYNDYSSGYTKGVGFCFIVPKNWYFTANLENAFSFYIYPLKGAN